MTSFTLRALRAFDQGTGLVNGPKTLGRILSCKAFGLIDELVTGMKKRCAYPHP